MLTIGSKVICVDDSPGRITGIRPLHAGTVYCIEAFSPCGALKLLGLDLFYQGKIVAFAPDRFREVGTAGTPNVETAKQSNEA